MSKLSFLDGSAPDEAEDTPAVEAEAPAEAIEAPPVPEPVATAPERGPDGKFLAKAAAEPDAAPTPATPPAPGHVPISAMLDEREKRQALERQLADLRARAEPPPPLEPTEALQAALYGQNLRASRKFAEREYGKETIATVHQWAAERCDADPAFNQQMRSSDDPYEAAYQAYNREQIVAEVKPGDLEAFRAWKAANAAVQAQPTSSAASPPTPRTLANASGTGAVGKDHVNVAEGNSYAALFPT